MTRPTETALTCADVSDLVAGAAVDALSAAEQVTLNRHLVNCAACQKDLDELRAAASQLALGVPQVEPPAGLGDRILSAALLAGPTSARPTPMSWRGRLRRVAPMWGAVAASVAVAIGSMVWAASLQSQVNQLSTDASRYHHVVSVLESQQLATRPLQPASADAQGSGMVYIDPSTGQGMVMVRNLPPLPQDRAWQVWFVRGTQRVSAGMLWTDQRGNGYCLISVPGDVKQFDSVGLTSEPAHGSPWPTTPRVVGATLQ